ncbi:BgtE-5545 [Blumeria graminis f. sp. tritici]|uniref:BgtE-5545 n=2 Tax=Blumeria graminis f. sp. tritici TaxID=62690 RepID=A0A381LGJ3_BLUGR|nr:putative secreted effector protein [Blumeria graminis f. sp. tritici 96224]VCU40779.1 BgtE-5545 [Blumeria graminis f. sp. tritici]
MISRLSLLSMILGLFISESAARYVCPGGKVFQDSDVRTRADEIYSLGEQLDSQRAGQTYYRGIKFVGSKNGDYYAYEGPFYPQEESDKTYKIQVVYQTQVAYLIEVTQSQGKYSESNCNRF